MTVPTPGARVLEVASALARGASCARRAKLSAAVAVPLALGIAASTTACTGSRGGSAQSPVELVIAPIGSLPDGGIVTNGEHAAGRCSLRLVATRIEKSSPGCYLDEHINKGPGLLHYPCGGADGPVEADFGENRYTGRLAGGDVELQLSGELDWEDGCHWGTHAVIRGKLVSNGEPTLKKLAWQYEDEVITGTDCSGVCTASATIHVTSAKGRAPELPATHDEDDDED